MRTFVLLTSCMTLAFLYKEARVMVAAIDRMTMTYKTNVKANPLKVPLGIALLGCFRSPDMLAPLEKHSKNYIVSNGEGNLGCLRKDAASCGKQDAK